MQNILGQSAESVIKRSVIYSKYLRKPLGERLERRRWFKSAERPFLNKFSYINYTLDTLHRQFCRFLRGRKTGDRIDDGDRIDVGGDTIDGWFELSFAYDLQDKNI